MSYCETHGKRRYSSRKEAKRAFRRRNSETVHVYRCEISGWHVTTQSAELTAMHRMLELKEKRGEASDKTIKRFRQRLRAAEREVPPT